ncbi:VOC family protein [Blastococcus tunisiensis]|uniref:PhnB protein n=1 Tax=Blastococcus tunisiensis TaxID=1798228 RepID=A0A1I2DP24_9ACTN|nr:VOC family protein [Blastococcus sp. DSM 46838]SFE82227.1 PhnB protein [Blastococcus sp. DSM 46838]
MTVQTVAHLNFHGQAREALEHNASVFGGRTVIATYGDVGMPPELPDAGDVVFGQVVGADGFGVMAYDVPGQARTSGTVAAGAAPTTRRENGVTLTAQPFFLSVRGQSVDEVGALWEKLAVGATVVEPFGPSPWAPASGMLTDRFGVTWILDVAAPGNG